MTSLKKKEEKPQLKIEIIPPSVSQSVVTETPSEGTKKLGALLNSLKSQNQSTLAQASPESATLPSNAQSALFRPEDLSNNGS